jgi:hypothetical protein
LLLLLLLLQAPSDVSDLVCCYGNNTLSLDCVPYDRETCGYGQYNKGREALGKCGDTPNPCDVGACCPPIDDFYDVCRDFNPNSPFDGVRGSCHFDNVNYTFYEGETCAQTCRTLRLGACCTKATRASAPSCTTGKTYTQCIGDLYQPDSTFLGFARNKTCDEVDCAQYGACCSSERTYQENITWSCSPGCRSGGEDGAPDNKRPPWTPWADFVQGSTCSPPAKLGSKGCLGHIGACCYMRGANRMCVDQVSRKACSNRPSYVSFHAGATCESVGNCTTTSYGACLSPPRYLKYGRYMWSCIAGDSEEMCFARYAGYSAAPYWFPQHAPGYSCLGYTTGDVATTNSILKQRGACWSFNGTAGVRQCNNNMPRSVCMAKPGFLGFNASKTCSQTRTVSGVVVISTMRCS